MNRKVLLSIIPLLFIACGEGGDATKSDQNITFENIAPHNLSEGSFSLTATASSGLPVTFTSSAPSVASVSGTTVTLRSEGETIITASQDGDDKWFQAPKVTKTLIVNDDNSVNKKSQTITFDIGIAEFASNQNGAKLTLEAVATSGLPITFTAISNRVHIEGNTLTILDTGIHFENVLITITASQGGNNEWNAAPTVSQQLTISHVEY
ncbi:MAG: hypothetical protein LBS54_06305 [Dysgonamonadaceae bacterium]|nr:hypothetical protein [Dysgonamonadaceae bacterium]